MHGVEWTPGILRHCYFATIEHWRALGIEPDRLAAMAPGVGEKYGTFRVKRRHLERQPFDQVKAIELVRLAPGGANETAEWEAFTTFSARSRALVLGVVPSVLGPRAESLMSHFREVVQMAGGTYGYRYLQRMAFGPMWYPGGINYGDRGSSRPRDLSSNITWWSRHQNRAYDAGLLRDIYPHNYLSDECLSMLIGHSGLTLQQWIETEPVERGELHPLYTDALTEWTPPIPNIPLIRERLFRAGRIFYWRFFNPSNRRADAPSMLVTGLANRSWQEPDPLYRPNLLQPWEAPEPIPEIYTAEYYKDKDPGLTY